MNKIKKSNKAFTLVELMIAVAIVILLVALSINGLMRSRITANEAAAIKALKTLHSAFASFRTANRRYPESLEELGSRVQDPPYIDDLLAEGERQGFYFWVESFDGAGDGVNTFVISAIPVDTGITGNREFYLTESGEVIEGNAEQALGVATH